MKVAVVGSGVSGLAATWLLNEYSPHDVHLFESDSRPGGHANTVHFKPQGAKKGVDVDTGFIVCNPTTYPNFLRFLALHPSVVLQPTEMTFSVSRDGGKFEWAGKNFMTIFCQPWRLLDPNMWRLLYDVLRFNASARRIVFMREHDAEEYSIGQYLDREGYSDSFRDNYLIPMTSAIWSTPPDKCAMDFPARTLLQFMHNHHLLQITGKPPWLTLQGGSKTYVNEVLSKLPSEQLHLSSAIQSLRTLHNGQVELATADATYQFDHVIMACHSDTALSILKAGGGVTLSEEEILGAFQWNRNEVILHSDASLMPTRKIAWSCWNYLTYSSDGKDNQISLTSLAIALLPPNSILDGMNDLQHISESKYGPVLVTLNAPFEPNPDTVGGRFAYSHPVLDRTAVKAQRRLPEIQNKRGISYGGAYLNFGFHEDGFTSGLLAASYMKGIKAPFEFSLVDGSSWAPTPPESQISRDAIVMLVLATLFDIFEATGMRALCGFVLRLQLSWVKFVLSSVGCGLGVHCRST